MGYWLFVPSVFCCTCLFPVMFMSITGTKCQCDHRSLIAVTDKAAEKEMRVCVCVCARMCDEEKHWDG